MARLVTFWGGPKDGAELQVPEHGPPEGPWVIPNKVDVSLTEKPPNYDPSLAEVEVFARFAVYEFNGVRNRYEYRRTVQR